MNFNELSWAAFCFYYRSSGDKKYCGIMRDKEFLRKLREAPNTITAEEFEEKIILDYVNIESYDLLIGHNLARTLLAKISDVQPEISALSDKTLVNCNLWDNNIIEKIQSIYTSLYSVRGLWLTGVSKIAHLLNDRLLPLLNLDISNHFRLMDDNSNLLEWLRITQRNAVEITTDFTEQGFPGTPEEFLSEKLGYSAYGCQKPLIKFMDEYFWLKFGENLPIPPRWVPLFVTQENKAKY